MDGLVTPSSTTTTTTTGTALDAKPASLLATASSALKTASKVGPGLKGSYKASKAGQRDSQGARQGSRAASLSVGRAASTSITTGATKSVTSLVLAGGGDAKSNTPGPAPTLLSTLRRQPAVHVVVNNLDTKLQRRSATRLVGDGKQEEITHVCVRLHALHLFGYPGDIRWIISG